MGFYSQKLNNCHDLYYLLKIECVEPHMSHSFGHNHQLYYQPLN